MANDKYPALISGMAKNKFAETFVLDTMPITQEQADQMCAAIQTAVGGKLEVREWNGVTKNGKNLPGFKLEAVSATQLAERKAYGARNKATAKPSVVAHVSGDDAL